MKIQGFPSRERLKKNEDIREVFNSKKAVNCSGAKLLTQLNNLPYNRIAFTFPRKFGNAVTRNYSRRISREAYRQMRKDLKPGYDLVLLAYNNQDDFAVRVSQLKALFSRAGLL
ncbi:MAG: ribonuclease P protein component [Treponema sp.]|nr:ribonuclease P protein component [Treponema sp.]